MGGLLFRWLTDPGHLVLKLLMTNRDAEFPGNRSLIDLLITIIDAALFATHFSSLPEILQGGSQTEAVAQFDR